jgi:hypothetical protein
MKLDPNTFQFNIPASRSITFTVTDTDNIELTGTTGSDGYYFFNVPYNGDTNPRTINVQALFQPDPNDEAKTITDSYNVTVTDNKVISENFDNYPPGTTSFRNWQSLFGPIVVSPGYNSPQSIRLPQNSFFYADFFNHSSYEYRFAVKIGNEDLNGDDITRGTISCHGLIKNSYALHVLTFKDKNKLIEDCNENILTSYSSGWIPIKIQINYNWYTNTAKINYWINGVIYGPVYANDVSILSSFTDLSLTCRAGSMWFDNIEIYSSYGLIEQHN